MWDLSSQAEAMAGAHSVEALSEEVSVASAAAPSVAAVQEAAGSLP